MNEIAVYSHKTCIFALEKSCLTSKATLYRLQIYKKIGGIPSFPSIFYDSLYVSVALGGIQRQNIVKNVLKKGVITCFYLQY